jgi:hypothetical protein
MGDHTSTNANAGPKGNGIEPSPEIPPVLSYRRRPLRLPIIALLRNGPETTQANATHHFLTWATRGSYEELHRVRNPHPRRDLDLQPMTRHFGSPQPCAAVPANRLGDIHRPACLFLSTFSRFPGGKGLEP